jgi:hypothetical protein
MLDSGGQGRERRGVLHRLSHRLRRYGLRLLGRRQ